jgi:hypothetical protein
MDVNVLAMMMFRGVDPFSTRRARTNIGSNARGTRAISVDRKCGRSTGNVDFCQGCVNSGSVDIAAHATSVEMMYPTRARFLDQAHPSIADIRIEAVTKPAAKRNGLMAARWFRQ